MPRRLLLPLAVVALLAGCGGDDGSVATPTSSASAPAPAPPVQIVLTPLDVRLVAPGEQPRAVLRHELRPGSTSTGELTFALDVEGVAGAEIVGPSTITVRAVDGNGTATAAYALEGLDVTSRGEGDAIPTAADALDITGEVVVTADRTATSATVQTTSSGDIPGLDAVAGSLDPRLTSLLFPFPSEPIGPGAEWEIRGPLPFFGATVELEALARLVSRSAEQFEIGIAVTLASPPAGSDIAIDLSGFGEIGGTTSGLVPRSGSIVATGGIVLPDRGPDPIPTTMELRIAGQ